MTPRPTLGCPGCIRRFGGSSPARQRTSGGFFNHITAHAYGFRAVRPSLPARTLPLPNQTQASRTGLVKRTTQLPSKRRPLSHLVGLIGPAEMAASVGGEGERNEGEVPTT